VCSSSLPPAHAFCDPGGIEGPSYARRKPEATVLYQVVREELETFLAGAASRERPVPRFVARELRGFHTHFLRPPVSRTRSQTPCPHDASALLTVARSLARKSQLVSARTSANPLRNAAARSDLDMERVGRRSGSHVRRLSRIDIEPVIGPKSRL
jgi:hypothetical protein